MKIISNFLFVLKSKKESKQVKEATYLGFVDEKKIGKIKIEERNIFLSRDSCSCRAKRLRTGDSFKASERQRTGIVTSYITEKNINVVI